MRKEIATAILNVLRDKNHGTGISEQIPGTPLPFDKTQFKQIQKRDGGMTFIDGGNNELIGTPHCSVQFIRIASLRLPEKKRSINEGIIVIESKGNHFYVKNFDLPYEFPELSLEDATPQSAASTYRRLAELQCAIRIQGSVCLDGSFECKHLLEEEYLNQLKQEIVCAVSKTSQWKTNTGFPLLTAIKEIGPEHSWLYSPLFESEEYPANIGIVKLHNAAKYVFKIETLKGDLEEAASILAANSTDPVFPGYPYGLIAVDRLARVSEDEKRYFLTRLFSFLKEDKEKIQALQRCLDAHDILDSIS